VIPQALTAQLGGTLWTFFDVKIRTENPRFAALETTDLSTL